MARATRGPSSRRPGCRSTASRLRGQERRSSAVSAVRRLNIRKAIAFSGAAGANPARSPPVRVAFEPVLNTFNGRTSVELQVLDIALPE